MKANGQAGFWLPVFCVPGMAFVIKQVVKNADKLIKCKPQARNAADRALLSETG